LTVTAEEILGHSEYKAGVENLFTTTGRMAYKLCSVAGGRKIN